jgi:hypothetical protein
MHVATHVAVTAVIVLAMENASHATVRTSNAKIASHAVKVRPSASLVRSARHGKIVSHVKTARNVVIVRTANVRMPTRHAIALKPHRPRLSKLRQQRRTSHVVSAHLANPESRVTCCQLSS